MKKVISVLMCFVLLIGVVPVINAGAADLDQIAANEEWIGSWGTGVETKYIYLTVDETGYYDFNLEDLNKTACLEFSMYDLDMADLDYTWDKTSLYFEIDSQYSYENIYLIADHMYQIECRYGSYDSDYQFIHEYANVKISFTKTDYQPIALTLGKTNNLTISTSTNEWYTFSTTTVGDYQLNINLIEDFYCCFYEKTTGKQIGDLFSSGRICLSENSDYIIRFVGYSESAVLARFSISKAEKDVENIDIVQNYSLLADDGYIYESYASLKWFDIENLLYNITYSDGSSEVLSHYGLTDKGIYIGDIEYNGEKINDGYEWYFKSGKQPVTIYYMNSQTSSSYVNVATYVNFFSYLNGVDAYDEMCIRYENGSSETYYWYLTPSESNCYALYSYDWDEISANYTIFDENNNVVTGEGPSWYLKGGEEYCLRISYTYEEYCYSDVEFQLEPYREHVHTQGKNIVTKKATTTTNGEITCLCKMCGYEMSVKPIYAAKTVKLSASSYTYDGKVKKPTVIVKDSTGKTIPSSNYTVIYSSGRKNVGEYKVTVKFKGNYTGTKTLYFSILPPKTSIKTVKGKKKSISVTVVKKATQVTGYQIQYSTSAKFKSPKILKIKNAKTTSATIKNLTAKKVYYVRSRTYKTVNGKTYYSSWSSYKSAKTK